MPKSTLPLISALLLATIVVSPSWAQTSTPFLLDQKVTLSDVSATVTVQHMRYNWIAIAVKFSGRNSVSCLSVYKDLRYTLRNDKGQTVPINQAMLNNPPPEATANHVTTAARQEHPSSACVARPGVTVKLGSTFLSYLYPDLAPGK